MAYVDPGSITVTSVSSVNTDAFDAEPQYSHIHANSNSSGSAYDAPPEYIHIPAKGSVFTEPYTAEATYTRILSRSKLEVSVTRQLHAHPAPINSVSSISVFFGKYALASAHMFTGSTLIGSAYAPDSGSGDIPEDYCTYIRVNLVSTFNIDVPTHKC